MSLFDFTVEDAQDQMPVPAGEYELLVEGAEETTSKAGVPMIKLRCTIKNPPSSIVNPGSVFHYFLAPTGSDPAQDNRRKLDLRNFLEAAKLPTAPPFDANTFVGHSAWAVLSEEDDEQYGKSNRVKRWTKGA